MLVLSRKIGERILVPQHDLTITVMAAKGNNVRLGIQAPSKVGVFREEIWQRIREELGRSCLPDTVPSSSSEV